MIVDVHDKQGKVVEQIELDDSVWAIEPNIPVMHQALVRQLANARLGTRDTKTRGEVRGGGAQAVAPEGHRPRAPGLDPLAAVDGRRCRLGAASALVLRRTCRARCGGWRFARRSRPRCATSG